VAAVDLVDAIIPALTVDSRLSKAEILGLVRTVFDMDPNALQAATIPVKASRDSAHLELDQPAAGRAIQWLLAVQPPVHEAPDVGPPSTTLPPPPSTVLSPPPTPTLAPPACPEG
jgi:hypothetical protein